MVARIRLTLLTCLSLFMISSCGEKEEQQPKEDTVTQAPDLPPVGKVVPVPGGIQIGPTDPLTATVIVETLEAEHRVRITGGEPVEIREPATEHRLESRTTTYTLEVVRPDQSLVQEFVPTPERTTEKTTYEAGQPPVARITVILKDMPE